MLWVGSGDDTRWMRTLFSQSSFRPAKLQVTAAPEVSDLRWDDLRKCLGSDPKSQVGDTAGQMLLENWSYLRTCWDCRTDGRFPAFRYILGEINVSFLEWFNKMSNAEVKPMLKYFLNHQRLSIFQEELQLTVVWICFLALTWNLRELMVANWVF